MVFSARICRCVRLFACTAAIITTAGPSVPTLAQNSCDVNSAFLWTPIAGESTGTDTICSSGHCARPEPNGATYLRLGGAGCAASGTCTIEAVVPLEFPFNRLNTNYLKRPLIWWFLGDPPAGCEPPSNCSPLASCATLGSLTTDYAETFVRLTTSCQELREAVAIRYTVQAWSCPITSLCKDHLELPLTVDPVELATFLGCPPPPPPERCGGDASCQSCPGGNSIGGGGAAAGGGGGGPGDGPDGGSQSGPQAYLYYTAGGSGGPGLPGSAAWAMTLGRYWSHNYAQRIVEDPLDPSDPADSHVWLITEYGTFREFGNLTGGVYERLAPSGEYRTLERTGTGWTLTDLDGTVMEFDNDGKWLSTTERNPAVVTQGIYDLSGRLEEVDLPDLRKELYAYYEAPDPAEGKLKTITEVGIDGATTYAWHYHWTGDDLTRIERPDGTDLEYAYATDPIPAT